MKKIYIIILYLIVVIPVMKDWRFNDLSMKYKKQLKLTCIDNHYYWTLRKNSFAVPALDNNECLVKCK
jgi:hypothetical protein